MLEKSGQKVVRPGQPSPYLFANHKTHVSLGAEGATLQGAGLCEQRASGTPHPTYLPSQGPCSGRS